MPLFRILKGHRHAKRKFMVNYSSNKKHGFNVRVFNLNDFTTKHKKSKHFGLRVV